MLLLLTTLLTARTNESHGTIDERHATHDRNILTYRTLSANDDDDGGSSTDVDTKTIKEKESATQPSGEEQKNQQLGSGNYFEINSTLDNKKENIGETMTGDDGNATRNSAKHPSNHAETKEEQARSNNHLDRGQNKTNPTNDSERERKILGIDNKLGFVEEIHVFHEEGEDEEILVEIIDEDTNDDKARVTHIYLEEKALENAVEFGMHSVEELTRVKEPLWYNMGEYLSHIIS